MSDTTMTVPTIVIIAIAVTSVDAFLLNTRPGVHYSTRFHWGLTKAGANLAVIHLLIEQNLASTGTFVIEEYFGTDTDNKDKFREAINAIALAVSTAGKEKKANAAYSVNGEEIQSAHNLVCQMRNEIISLARNELTDTTKSLILEKIGQTLFIIQSFYSNTNWVNMKGATVYEDFGLCGQELMPIALREEATCKDCSVFAGENCKDTLMIQNALTSGYRSGQDILKPEASWSSKTIGKCSHGGKYDDTRTTTAKGGINKETTHSDYSPMYHLHNTAAEAAEAATEFFFTGKDSGLYSVIGHDKFMSLLNVIRRGPTSLTFVLDVTLSMHDNINSVTKALIDTVTGVIGTNNEPEKYILSMFSEPADKTKTYNTTDGTAMIDKLNSITLENGIDCPEYAMDGLLKGIQLSNIHSTVYLITDAPAKDCEEEENVLELARQKNITIDIFLPKECPQAVCVGGSSRRRKRENAYLEHNTSTYIRAPDDRWNDVADQNRKHTGDIRSSRHKRSAAAFYKDFAESTGGTLYEPTAGISTVLNEVIQSYLPSSNVLVHLFDSPTTGSSTIPINVDSDIQLIKIEIAGSSSATEATVRNPTGSTEYTLRYYSNNRIMITVTRPVSGTWTLEKNLVLDWSVRITAVATMDISYRLLDTDSDGYAYQVQGNPIGGQNYTVEVTVTDAIENATDFTIVVMRENGEEMVSSAVSCTESVDGKICPITLTVPTEKAYLQLQGRDGKGNLFRRTSDSPLIPVDVKLRLGIFTSSLYVGVQHAVPYTLTNAGNDIASYTVQYINDKSDSTIDSTSHVLTSNESIDGSFHIIGNSDGEVVKYTISVNSGGSSSLLQSLSRTVMFTSKQHPVCTVINIYGNCSSSDDQCSSLFWSTTSQISYSGVSLQNVYLSNADSTVTLDYDNNTGSPVKVTVNGTCCTTSVYLNVIDDESYTDRCNLQFGDVRRMIMQVIDGPDSQDILDLDDSTALMMILAISCTSVVLILAASIFVIIWKCKVQPNKNTDDEMVRYTFFSYEEENIERFRPRVSANKLEHFGRKTPIRKVRQHQKKVTPTGIHKKEDNIITFIQVSEYKSSPGIVLPVSPPPSYRSNDVCSLYTDSRSSTMADVHS